ncbi:DUF4314 domain-containing protein [Schaedlerella sp.]|uniref:DUF4314 domain-containing protein n=1 Tax=Schaedlerella sp. TaxID=2676057 RepID=UPI00374530A8
MHTVSKKQLELLRKRYPAGTPVCLDAMEGESRMTPGLKGRALYVDDAGQIHVQWENGSGLALIPGVDQFHKISDPEKKKEKGEPSR